LTPRLVELDVASIASQLRELACSQDTTWSFGSYVNPETGLMHFGEELEAVQKEAGVDLNDVLRMCKTGKITKGETDVEPPQYRMEGITTDGVHIGLGVSFNAKEKWIELVTVFVVGR